MGGDFTALQQECGLADCLVRIAPAAVDGEK